MDDKDTNPATAGVGNGGSDDSADSRSSNPLEEAREKFTRVAEDLQGRYSKAKRDVQQTAEKAERELHRGADRARQRYGEAEERLRQSYHVAQDRAGEWNTDFNDYVRESPGKAILAAAGLGFLIGLAFRRGRR